MPAGANGHDSTDPSIPNAEGGVEYHVEVLDAAGCIRSNMISVGVAPDPIPGSVAPSLMVRKEGASDLHVSWMDTADPVSSYELNVLHCDTDADLLCDVDPTPAALGNMPDMQYSVAAGDEFAVIGPEPDSFLIYMKVRGTSPCSATPGPYHTP